MFLNSLGFEPERAVVPITNFTGIEPKTYPPGRYVLRVKNYDKEDEQITLGFYGTDYITIKRADRMKYKNFISEFLKAHYGDHPSEKPVSVGIWSVLRYNFIIFKNNTDIIKFIDIHLEKEDPAQKLSKIFEEKSNTVKLTAKPGESVVIYSKSWIMKPTYQFTDDDEESIKAQQQKLQKEETKSKDFEKEKPQQEKIQQVITQQESLNGEEEDNKNEHPEVKDSKKEDTKREDLEIENF